MWLSHTSQTTVSPQIKMNMVKHERSSGTWTLLNISHRLMPSIWVCSNIVRSAVCYQSEGCCSTSTLLCPVLMSRRVRVCVRPWATHCSCHTISKVSASVHTPVSGKWLHLLMTVCDICLWHGHIARPAEPAVFAVLYASYCSIGIEKRVYSFWFCLGRSRRGRRIWKEHMRVSSTLMIAPALLNSPQ